MRKRPVVAALLLLVGSTANAEVRLVRGARGPELSVRPVARGIWTPVGTPDAATVNPAGDVLGDGYPSQATTDGRLVAAWQRPSARTLTVLTADSSTAFVTVDVASGGGYGTPIVAAVDSTALIAWQATDGEATVMAALVTEDGTSDPVEIIPGRLVGAHLIGDAVHVLSYHPADATMVVATYLGLHLPDPIPVPSMRTVVLLLHEPSPIPVPVGAHAAADSSDTWMPCVDVREADVLVAWQARQGQIGRVLLTEFGVVGEGRLVRGPNGSCQAILNAAVRN